MAARRKALSAASAAVTAGLLALAGSLAPAAAQDYPSKPIRLIVPWSPGGGTDVLARLIAAKLSEGLKQQVIVENKAGAASMIGMAALANAAADGYTLALATSNLASNPYLYAQHPFDVQRDLAPVVLVSKGVYAMAVHPAVPAQTVGELITLVRANPDRYNAAMIGAGAPPHLALTQFMSMTGAKVVGINYKGAGPAMAATVAGETHLMFSSYATMQAMVEAGRLRALAVTSARRTSAAPNIPTASESGLPGFVFDEWYAIFAPAKTPRAVVDRINAEVRKVLELPDVRERMRSLASEPSAGSPEALGEFLKSEMTRFQKLITENNIKAE
jgi:tripartite-type tricarboxylate transporter receptor subunit TctC